MLIFLYILYITTIYISALIKRIMDINDAINLLVRNPVQFENDVIAGLIDVNVTNPADSNILHVMNSISKQCLETLLRLKIDLNHQNSNGENWLFKKNNGMVRLFYQIVAENTIDISINPNIKNNKGEVIVATWGDVGCVELFFKYKHIHSEPVSPKLVPKQFAYQYVQSLDEPTACISGPSTKLEEKIDSALAQLSALTSSISNTSASSITTLSSETTKDEHALDPKYDDYVGISLNGQKNGILIKRGVLMQIREVQELQQKLSENGII